MYVKGGINTNVFHYHNIFFGSLGMNRTFVLVKLLVTFKGYILKKYKNALKGCFIHIELMIDAPVKNFSGIQKWPWHPPRINWTAM